MVGRLEAIELLCAEELDEEEDEEEARERERLSSIAGVGRPQNILVGYDARG